jgi:hypothetical protein
MHSMGAGSYGQSAGWRVAVDIFGVHEPTVNLNHELTVATSSNHLPDRTHTPRRHV